MYFVETGLGEPYKPREQPKTPPARQSHQTPRKAPPKAPPKGPPDRLSAVYTHWDLSVPFRQDIKAFGQEVAKAIGRHVAASEKTKINSLLVEQRQQKNLKDIHVAFSGAATESNFVIVRATLRFTKNDHTGFDWMNIDLPTLSVKDSIK